MPFVEGETLRARLARGAVPVDEALRLLRDIASAIVYAHEHGVVHRDIKPENVLITDGRAVVTDLGVARAVDDANRSVGGVLTSVGMAVGTPAYMAPEQAVADGAMDHRVDLYAFGVLAWEMLVGRHPYTAGTAQQMLAAHCTAEPASLARSAPQVPSPLASLVHRCLAKAPNERPGSARELREELEALIVPARGLREAAHASRRLSAVGLLIVIVAALGTAGVLARGRSPAATPPRLAVLPFDDHTRDTAVADIGVVAAHMITSGLARELPRRVIKMGRQRPASQRNDGVAARGGRAGTRDRHWQPNRAARLPLPVFGYCDPPTIDAGQHLGAGLERTGRALESWWCGRCCLPRCRCRCSGKCSDHRGQHRGISELCLHRSGST